MPCIHTLHCHTCICTSLREVRQEQACLEEQWSRGKHNLVPCLPACVRTCRWADTIHRTCTHPTHRLHLKQAWRDMSLSLIPGIKISTLLPSPKEKQGMVFSCKFLLCIWYRTALLLSGCFSATTTISFLSYSLTPHTWL